MEQQEQTTKNSRENYSVIWITLAVSKSREHLPKLLWGAFAGDKPPSNGSPGSLGSSLQTVCHGTERINNPHFHFLFMALITDDKTYSKWRKEGKKLASPVCLWDSLLGNERELKLWRICKCVYGVGGGWTDINRLAWRRAGRGPAHSAVSVRSSLPILMRYFEGLSSGLHWGPPGVRWSDAVGWVMEGPGGSLWQREGMAEVRHSTYQDGRWLNNLNEQRGWHETSSRSRTGNHSTFPVNPVGPWCQPFVFRNIL